MLVALHKALHKAHTEYLRELHKGLTDSITSTNKTLPLTAHRPPTLFWLEDTMSFGYLNNNINSNYFQAQAAAAALPTPSPPVQRKPTPFITPPERSPLTWRRCSSQHDSNEQSFSFEPQPPPLPLLLPPASDVPKFAEIKRQHKQNPVIMSREDVREKRRAMFLSKVKDAREHSRIQSRGGEDEVCRHQPWPISFLPH